MKRIPLLLSTLALLFGCDDNDQAAPSSDGGSNQAVEVVRSFYEAADARPFDPEAVRRFYADGFVDHDAHGEGNFAEGAVGTFSALADGAPDSTHELALVVPSGDDMAIVYWRYRGTNTNGLFGFPTLQPARSFDIAGIEIYRVRDGQFTDMWHVEEIANLTEALTSE